MASHGSRHETDDDDGYGDTTVTISQTPSLLFFTPASLHLHVVVEKPKLEGDHAERAR